LTPLGWVTAICVVVGIVGLAIGFSKLWIVALAILLVALMMAIGIPRNVRDLNVPPGFTNAPDDLEPHDEDR
jgi:hypothetical protein